MPTIEAFKAEMKKGFARPNLFKVEISKTTTSKQRLYQMSCFQAQIPGHNIATTDKDIGFRSIAYQKIYSDVILGFYVNTDLDQLKYFQHWIDTIVNNKTNHHRYYDDYVGTVKITQENRLGDEVATWTLHDAYPKQIDPIQLDYGTNDAVMTCNATMTYRNFTVVYGNTIIDDKDRPEETKRVVPNNESDVNENNLMPLIKKPVLLRITQEEFDKMYPAFDKMDRAEQQAILYLYGKDYIYKESSSGGALHHVTT